MRLRIEKDPLGRKKVPLDAYYGIQTLRAVENFPISKIPPKPVFIKATAMVKYCAALTNAQLGLLDRRLARAIIKAAKEVISGRFDSQFLVDAYQAGAGTSHNMNANEVIANRAIELLGGKKGDYSVVHPNDHVNLSQSTNDTFPTAMRISMLMSWDGLGEELKKLEASLREKARVFDDFIKSGRTHLQDAVPVRLGQEFSSYAESMKRCRVKMEGSKEPLKTLGIGATAVGTGINTHPRYARVAVKNLSMVSGIKGLREAENKFEAISSMADFVHFSSSLKTLSIELIRIANDLRLLSSGPRTGLSEIKLPAVQPGSSIMPGKKNPVMAEMLDMVCFQVIGNDLAVTMAAQAGQLELNVMMPVINHNILQSLEILTNSIKVFTGRCVRGIRADRERCREYFEKSLGLATLLNPYIGYEKASTVAKESVRKKKTLMDIIREKKILTEKELNRILNPRRITAPHLMSKQKTKRHNR